MGSIFQVIVCRWSHNSLENTPIGCIFDGLSIAPKYQERFDELANEAVEYYND